MHAPYYSTYELSHQNPVIAHKGLQGAPILEYPLHYKDNLTTIYVFMVLRYYTQLQWISESAHQKNIMEHCNDLQNWQQGIECHSGSNETRTLPPVDSCLEYHPNDYSNLEESKADGLSCSPIKVPVLIWQGFIDCAYLAYVVLHLFYFVAPPSA